MSEVAMVFEVNRKRKASKRALCPYINSQIMNSAQSGNIHLLLSTVRQYREDMNLVNQTTSMHRLAKLSSESATARQVLASPENQIFIHRFLDDIGQSLNRSEKGMTSSRTQAVSNLLWSLGILRCVNLDVISITVNLACNKVECFKAFDLASTARAYAKLSQSDPSIESLSSPFFQVAIEPLIRVIPEMSAGPLTMVIWAYAKMQVLDQTLFDLVAERFLSLLPESDLMPQQLLDLTFSYSKAGFHNEPVLMAVAAQVHRRIAQAFPFAELVELTQLLAQEDIFCWDFYVAIADRAGHAGISAGGVAKVVTALALAKSVHPVLNAAISELLGSWGSFMATTTEVSALGPLFDALGTRFRFSTSGNSQEDLAPPSELAGFLQACTKAVEVHPEPYALGGGGVVAALLKAMIDTKTPVPPSFSDYVESLVNSQTRLPSQGPSQGLFPSMQTGATSSYQAPSSYDQSLPGLSFDDLAMSKRRTSRTDASSLDAAPPGLATAWKRSPTASTSSLDSNTNLTASPVTAPLASPIPAPPAVPAPSFLDLMSKQERPSDPLAYRSDFAPLSTPNLFRDCCLDEGFSSGLQQVSVDKWFEDVDSRQMDSVHGDAFVELTPHRVSYAF